MRCGRLDTAQSVVGTSVLGGPRDFFSGGKINFWVGPEVAHAHIPTNVRLKELEDPPPPPAADAP